MSLLSNWWNLQTTVHELARQLEQMATTRYNLTSPPMHLRATQSKEKMSPCRHSPQCAYATMHEDICNLADEKHISKVRLMEARMVLMILFSGKLARMSLKMQSAP